jgi:hypothetical protein
MERKSSAACALDKVHLVGEGEAAAGQAKVGGEPNAACAFACKKRAFSGLSDGRKRPKRECPSSIFVGVCPFWSQDRLLYGFRLQYGDRDIKYGAYENEIKAALACDYAARRLAWMTPSTQWPMNSEQFFLQSECNVGRASSLSRQGSHGGIMEAFTNMLAVRGCGSSETIVLKLWELCCWLGI